MTTPFRCRRCPYRREEAQIIQWKQDNKLDELFRFLFIKRCNALNEILPGLFEKTTDYTEVLLNLSVVDQEGVVYKLTHDIPEKDFNIEQGGQVEISRLAVPVRTTPSPRPRHLPKTARSPRRRSRR